MKSILDKKGRQIVMSLLDTLSKSNQNELEKTLNANTILMEFCDSDHCFAMLTTPEALQRLIQICCQGQSNQMNLPYALNLLSTIINEFSNTEKEINDERKQQIQQLFAKFFPDMAYNCIMILQS
jgi:DNA replication protein DnaD